MNLSEKKSQHTIVLNFYEKMNAISGIKLVYDTDSCECDRYFWFGICIK